MGCASSKSCFEPNAPRKDDAFTQMASSSSSSGSVPNAPRKDDAFTQMASSSSTSGSVPNAPRKDDAFTQMASSSSSSGSVPNAPRKDDAFTPMASSSSSSGSVPNAPRKDDAFTQMASSSSSSGSVPNAPRKDYVFTPMASSSSSSGSVPNAARKDDVFTQMASSSSSSGSVPNAPRKDDVFTQMASSSSSSGSVPNAPRKDDVFTPMASYSSSSGSVPNAPRKDDVFTPMASSSSSSGSVPNAPRKDDVFTQMASSSSSSGSVPNAPRKDDVFTPMASYSSSSGSVPNAPRKDDVFTPMASSSSSSGSVPNAPRKYNVFISFRGEDTRNNFTSHLYTALDQAFRQVFLDNKKLETGDEIASALIQAIEDSSVSVIVFSEDYASSKWCLDELHHIMQYRKDKGQFVIPIFYKVEPSDVRNQTGAYKEAFEEHERKHDHDKVSRWKAALFEAGNLSGRHCQTFTDESEFIQKIVTDVRTKLEFIDDFRGTLKDLIGIDEMIEPIEELLEKYDKVGIWGIGGEGKTTMAKALFVKLCCRYDNCCFLENVSEKTKRNGLEHVRNSLISKLIGQDMQSNPSNDLMRSFVAKRLATHKALVVLDDVDSSKQLEDLLDNACNLLPKGSKVIITTRDKKLLKAEDYEIHEAKGLSRYNSRRLFIRKAFKSDCPQDGYEQLIEGFVDYTQNNPLAIKVLGSYVYREVKDFWDESLRKLRVGPPKQIQDVLRLSFDVLEYEQQQIFLDIGCFLKGESDEFVKELLESYGFHPTTGLQTLNDKALIVMTNGKVEMPALIQEMAYQIVREESIKKLGKRSRLWDPSEIHYVLNNSAGEEEVEGVMVNIHRIRPLHIPADTFNKTPKIRFLKFYSIWDSFFSNMCIKTNLESISTEMRYFHWEGYPGKSLPSSFCVKLLLELNLEHSHVETLWEGKQDLANLRRLRLGNCTKLTELPDFSKACRLKSVDLSGCLSLSYVPESVLSHDSLRSLSVRHCSNLKSLKSSHDLKSLEELDTFGCVKMKEFCVASEELRSLDLSKTLIEELNPSIGRCSKLTTLNLIHTELKHLPIQVLSCLTSLKELRMSDLLEIDRVGLHDLFDTLRSLESLSLMKCCVLTELPDNITQLSSLKELSLTDCRDLECLPELPRSLELLDVNGCTALLFGSSSIDVNGCTALLFGSSSIDHLSNLNRLCLNASSLGLCPLTKLCEFKLVELRIHSYCQSMEEAKLETVFDALPYLEMLCLEEWSHLTKLPSNVRHLSKLNYLSVKGCTELPKLPELPPSLRSLIATKCESLEEVFPATISRASRNKGKKFFSFIKCVNLGRRAIEEQARGLLKNAVHVKEDVVVYYPGDKVPKWFGNNQTRNGSDRVQLSLSFDNLMGFVFCKVILDSVPEENCFDPSIVFGVGEDQTAVFGQCFPIPEEDSPGSVLLCSNPAFSEKVLEKIEADTRNHEADTYNRTLFFKFPGRQKCGVYPIYASECSAEL